MRNQKMLWTLTTANAAMLIVSIATNLNPARAATGGTVLRGSALEIIDERGMVRASLDIEPAGVSAAGDAFTEKGRPSVKETYVVLEVGKASSQLKLRNEGGQESITRPWENS